MSRSQYQRPVSLSKGLTLIEVMVIVLVLAMLGVYSVSLIKNQAREAAEDKATIELMQFLEAAQNYFVDHNQWPANFPSDLTSQGYLPSEFSNAYSPWVGIKYQGELGQNSGQPPGLYYTVSTNTPSTTVASHIAARVPYGLADGSQVSASIPVPGAQQGYIASAGVLRLKYADSGYDPADDDAMDNHVFETDEAERTIDLPKCSPGFEGHYILSPQVYTTGFWCLGKQDNLDNKKCDNPGVVVRLGYGDVRKKGENKYYALVGDSVESSSIGTTLPHYVVYYVAFCIPNGSWANVNGAAPPSKDNNSQCGSNWGTYNQYGTKC